MLTSAGVHGFPRTMLFERLLCAALFAPLAMIQAATTQTATQPDELCEPARIGIVCKAGGAAVKARVQGLAELLGDDGLHVEIVVLDTMPAKSSAVPPPRFVLVIDEAKATATGAITEEYTSKRDLGQTFRIRWRGATAQAHVTLHQFGSSPGKLGEFAMDADWSKPPDTETFTPDQAKKEIVVEPAKLLGDVLEWLTRRALACAAGTDLWRRRADIGRIAEGLRGDASAAFWSRAAWTTGDDRAVAPWRSLEKAALESWRRAKAQSAAGGHPDGTCAWCGKESKGECACADATAMAGALRVLQYAAKRDENEKGRAAALKLEVPWDKLLPARPPAPGPELESVAKRLDAEHAADRAILRERVSIKEILRPEVRFDWYVVLALRDPLVWEPDDPDLVRHAARVVQAFGVRTGLAGASFDVESASPAIGLCKRRSGWEYTALEKREFTNSKTDLLATLVERAMWGNARGTPKAP